MKTKTARKPGPIWAGVFPSLMAVLEGVAAVVVLVNLPGDVENQRLLGLSTARLALALCMVGLMAGFGLLAWLFWRAPGWLRGSTAASRLRSGLFLGLVPLALVCVVTLNLLHDLYLTSGTFAYYALYERSAPLLVWMAVAALQYWAALAARGGFAWRRLAWQRLVYRGAVAGAVVVLVVIVMMIVTGLGLRGDQIGWGPPTVPLLEWQLMVGIFLALAMIAFSLRHDWNPRWNILLPVGLWVLACAVWLSAPLVPSYFATAGRAPNWEIYPFSDGAYYGHFAQSLLAGNGMQGQQVPPRPVYIALLALFHWIGGPQYEAVIAVQTLLLAGLPVLLYLLGAELHSRPVGAAAAVLAILREWTAIYAAPFTRNFSNSQLFFADLPAALAISGWVLLVVRWLKTPPERAEFARRAFLVGCALGLAGLVRTQSLFLLAPVLLLAALHARSRWRAALPALLALLVGVGVVMAPWVVRNRLAAGEWIIDHPDSQSGAMASRYRLSPVSLPPERLPGEGDAAYQARMQQSIRGFLWQHPGEVLRFVTAHFLNAQADNLQVLPLRAGVRSPADLLRPSWAFWQEWNGHLTTGQATALALYLVMVLVGVAAARARMGWAGWVPLLVQMAYHFSNALARNSGGRYLLPVDWVVYFYAVIGMVEILLSALLLLAGRNLERVRSVLAPAQLQSPLSTRRAALGGLALLVIGSVPVWLPYLFPNRYAEQQPAALIAQARVDGLDDAQAAALAEFSKQPGSILIRGRALYPRYYASGEGEDKTTKTGYEPLPFARTVLLVASPGYNGLVLLRAGPPETLPNTVDVIVAGCRVDNYLDAGWIIVEGTPGAVLRSVDDFTGGCP